MGTARTTHVCVKRMQDWYTRKGLYQFGNKGQIRTQLPHTTYQTVFWTCVCSFILYSWRCPVSRTRRHEPKIIWAWPRWEKPVQMTISYNPDPSTSTMCFHCWSLTQVPCLFLDNFDIRKLKNGMFERSPLGLHFGYDMHRSHHHTSELPCCPKPAIFCRYKYLLI